MLPAEKKSQFWLTRLLIQRALGFVYLFAFLIAAFQFVPLAGNHGIAPFSLLKSVPVKEIPSLFLFSHSDFFLRTAAWAGVLFSLLALTGISERFGFWFSVFVWTFLWTVYLSFVNTGQIFYGFGWEMLLLECGFLAIFLGDSKTEAPAPVIWLYRWVLFRVMFGAGLIKIRGDACWRDLSCMNYHYETQPLPNALSPFFHRLPHGWHKIEVLYTHALELVLPFFYFVPGIFAALAGAATIFFHIILICSGNLSWLNYITIASALSCFEDRFLKFLKIKVPETRPVSRSRRAVLFSLLGLILFLSISPVSNLCSARQIMNTSFEPLHLVNTYGAFGSITRRRTEVILEGTSENFIHEDTQWKEYEFKCKPGNVMRRPCVVSPYHYKIDWQMWFAAMSDFRYHPWILSLVAHLLENDPQTLSLIEGNPFPGNPPRWIRAQLYEYRFATPEEKKRTGAWWVRMPRGIYLPPLSLENPQFKKLLQALGFRPSA